MLLQDKMRHTKFSTSEQIVVDFMLDQQEHLKDYSTTMIAQETYTSPSILVRISKKLGFSGYSEFKKCFLEEVHYLMKDFKEIDANMPFSKDDTYLQLASKLVALKKESLDDTFSLLHYEDIQKAIHLMKKASIIKVFAISNMTFLAEEFVFKMRHIGKETQTYSLSNMIYQEAVLSTPSDCAICISYSGESGELLTAVNHLKHNQVPVIAITSIGQNTLTKLADVTLYTTTREKAYSKIGGFSSITSISLLLDTLYACYFQSDYYYYYAYKLKLAQQTEQRQIENDIVKEG